MAKAKRRSPRLRKKLRKRSADLSVFATALLDMAVRTEEARVALAALQRSLGLAIAEGRAVVQASRARRRG